MSEASGSSGWTYDPGRQDYFYYDTATRTYVYQKLGPIPDPAAFPDPAPYVLTTVKVGTPEQITEPGALRVGIRAHKRVGGGAGDAERLDPRYRKHVPGRGFYRVGKVFKVLWPEPAENLHSGATFVTGAYGEPIYNKIRWFVVIREGRDCCTCLSIQTYNGQGVAKPSMNKTEHSVIYTGLAPPVVSEQEDPSQQMLSPIPVVAVDPAQSRIDPMSRINYAKPYTVQHDVKSLEFGDVPSSWLDVLRQNFLSVLQRGSTPAQASWASEFPPVPENAQSSVIKSHVPTTHRTEPWVGLPSNSRSVSEGKFSTVSGQAPSEQAYRKSTEFKKSTKFRDKVSSLSDTPAYPPNCVTSPVHWGSEPLFSLPLRAAVQHGAGGGEEGAQDWVQLVGEERRAEVVGGRGARGGGAAQDGGALGAESRAAQAVAQFTSVGGFTPANAPQPGPTFAGSSARSKPNAFTPIELQQPKVVQHSNAQPAVTKHSFQLPTLDQRVQSNESLRQPETGDQLQAQSHSRYHSGKGTEMESLYSIGSTESAFGIPRDALQDAISIIGNDIIEKAGIRTWAPYALAKVTTSDFEIHLNRHLKQYADDLDRSISDPCRYGGSATNELRLADFNVSKAQSVVHLIRSNQLAIAHFLFQTASSTNSFYGPTRSSTHGSATQLSLDEICELLVQNQSSDDPLVGGLKRKPEKDRRRDFNAINDFLFAGLPFRKLMTEMRSTFYCDDRSQMRRIEDSIRETFTRKHEVKINLLPTYGLFGGTVAVVHGNCPSPMCLHWTELTAEWNPIEFLRSQYDNLATPIRSILVLSGSGLFTHATTCAEYFRSTWPNTCDILLPLLQQLLTKSTATLHMKDGGSLWVSLENRSIRGPTQNLVRFELVAPIGFTVEIMQQISWLAGTLRAGLPNSPLSYSEPSLVEDSSSRLGFTRFTLNVSRRPLDSKEKSCWFSLFSGAALTPGFPIPERDRESGLDIEIDILAELAGVRLATQFRGGVVLKSFSMMLIPTERTDDRVRWHVIRSEDGSFLSYEAGVRQCPRRLMIQDFDLDALHTTKTIVGWCSAVTLFLGSESINYDNLHYSGHRLEKLDSRVSISGGSIGFSKFATGQLNVTFGKKDGKCHFQRDNGPFSGIITMAEHSRILLYDTCERRAWLVPASHAILHIAQARHTMGFFGPSIMARVKLFSRDTSGCSARETLERDSANMIESDGSYRVKDLVLDIWSLLEYLTAHKDPPNAATGIQPKFTFREELHGFEFKDVVRKVSPCELKRCTISKPSGGWVDLIHDIDALTLFASGFEDLIKPSQKCQSLCRQWNRLPKDQEYLAVTVRMLKDLYEVAGSSLDRKFLSCSHLQWHQSRPIFKPCEAQHENHCGCNRLSQVFEKRSVGAVNGPGSLEEVEEGAVIFGFSGTLLDNIQTPRKNRKPGLYSQENQDISTQLALTNGGSSEPSLSGSGSSMQHSEANERTAISSTSTTCSNNHCDRMIGGEILKKMASVWKHAPPGNKK